MRRAAPAADIVAVLVFVVIGRSVHEHGLSVGGVASTAWPFLVGLGAGWAVLAARRTGPTAVVAGVVTCVATVAVGMVLRVLAGQGTAAAFVLVALAFLGAAMVGWRLAVPLGARWWRAGRAVP